MEELESRCGTMGAERDFRGAELGKPLIRGTARPPSDALHGRVHSKLGVGADVGNGIRMHRREGVTQKKSSAKEWWKRGAYHESGKGVSWWSWW